MPEWKDLMGAPMLLGFFMIAAVVAIKLIPESLKNRKEARLMELANAKEISLAEIQVRDKEAAARLAQAEATNGLTGQMKAASEVTEELSIFLKRSNELAKQANGRMDAIEAETADIRKVVTSIIGKLQGEST